MKNYKTGFYLMAYSQGQLTYRSWHRTAEAADRKRDIAAQYGSVSVEAAG